MEESLHIGSWWSCCRLNRHACLAHAASVTDGENTACVLLHIDLLVSGSLCAMLSTDRAHSGISLGISCTSSAYSSSIPPYPRILLCVASSSLSAGDVKLLLDLCVALPLELVAFAHLYASCSYRYEWVLQSHLLLSRKAVDPFQ